MDQNQCWRIVYQAIGRATRTVRPDRRQTYSDRLIVAMYFWAVLHDRAMRWACDRINYHGLFRPRHLPSVSQFHRRVKSPRVQQILQQVHDELAGVDAPTATLVVDGKSLPINPVSRDPDARWGHTFGRQQLGVGYKLHAYVTEDQRILCWCVRPLNEYEATIATLMLDHLPPATGRTLILGDANYDTHDFYKAVSQRGAKLLTGLRREPAKHPVTLRQMGKDRREALRLHEQNKPLVRMAMRNRPVVERTFANATNYGGGLGPLPAFVRRLPRVRRWVGAKIAIYHARLKARRLADKQNG
jgi:Transposase DDE domain